MSEKNIINMILSKGISSLIGVYSSFMLNLWLFDKTNSYIIFIINTTAISLIPLIFSIPAGIISDKIKKTLILIICDIITILSFLILIFITYFDYFNQYLYLFIISLISISNEFRYTATTSLIPELASKDNLIKYNSIQQIFRGGAIILGPILGGISYVQLSIYISLSIAIIAHIYSIIILMKISFNFNYYKSDTHQNVKYIDTFKWLWKITYLRHYFLSSSLVTAIMSSYMAIITPYILTSYNKNTLIFISVSQGVGLLLSVYISIIKKYIKEDVLYHFSIFTIGLSMLFIGIIKNDFIYIFTFFIGFGIGVIAIINQTIWQKYTPQNILGKVTSIRTFSLYILSPLCIYLTFPFTENISKKLAYIISYNIEYPTGITISLLGIFVLLISLFLLTKTGAKNEL
ncbi:MFS transporter [Muribacter muris]|uniref:MFS transporter n=2 Tax=Muribacter muris TaxID=67855 RepID=A0A4Y9K105_9PAST|nr:MFS transporter [Muribacter muris]MBF0784771.1 MFS transporter [Muribacter muris]TFV11192.1 MFS transporter [Muribacter muris]